METEKNAVDFVRYIAEQLCENKEDINIESNFDDLGIFITISVAESDMGKLIGKQGQNISAVRTLIRIIGARDNQRINLKVIEPVE